MKNKACVITKLSFIFSLIFLLFIVKPISAQILDPVTWSFSTKKISDTEAELILKAKIDKGWHLYSQVMPEDGPLPTAFRFTKSKSYEMVGKTTEPNVKGEFDKVFNATLKFFGTEAIFKQKIRVLDAKPFSVKGTVEFMACDDTKCLTPQEIDFDLPIKDYKPAVTANGKPEPNVLPTANSGSTEIKSTPDGTAGNQTSIDSNAKVGAEAKTDSAGTISASGSSDYEKINKNLWSLFFLSFLAGLAAILTPCVFPMIPMTVTFFMKDKQKAKAKLEAFVFGISIILIYTVIGTIVAVTLGANFANFISTHWLPNILFFLIFIFFAASFLGMFEITLPSWMVNKSDAQAEKGGFLGAFFMAFTLVLVSFSCTGPIVGAILVASAGGDVLQPIIGMFGFSLAFALPFGLFAFFPQWLSSLPKSGGWLNSVKVVLGFLELALGLKFLSIADQTYHWRILDREVYLALWIVIFFLMGMYLLGKLKFSHDSDLKFISVPRLMLAIITFAFVAYMVPGMYGAPLKALSGYIPPQTSLDFDINRIVRENSMGAGGGGGQKPSTICDSPKYGDFLHLPHGLEGYFDYEQGMACAKKQNKPVFIDFTGHGCVNCREMEANVWSAPEVLKKLREDFIIIALYVDDKTTLPESEWITSKKDGKVKNTIGKKYADLQISQYNVNAQPYYVLLDTNGQLLAQPQAYNLNIDNFVKFLDSGLAAFKKRTASN
jgi:thiol:disulfide interchange protein DsbD